jgi:inosine-uridine nucleoside N-ribohydrolase
MHRIHLDTDLGGDPDDLCALVMLLGWPDVHITGITTTQDDDGQRAGYVRHVLHMLGRNDIPVASGARTSMTTSKVASPFTGDTRYWPDPVEPKLSGATDAMDLLERSIRGGATVVCIGPVTNIAMFETFRGDMLRKRRLVVMGGYVVGPDAGFPQWGPEHDWNVQWDTRAMETVVNMDVSLTLVPYPVTMHAPLTMRDLERIEQSGPVGELIARQSRARAEDAGMGTIGRDHRALPDYLVNFHYDPVAVAVALGWDGAKVERHDLMPYVENGVLSFEPSPAGRPIDVCTAVDGEAFTEVFIQAVREAQR